MCAGLIGEMFMWHWEFVPGHTRWLAPVLVMHWNLISLLALLAAIVQEWVTERTVPPVPGRAAKGEEKRREGEEVRQAVSLC